MIKINNGWNNNFKMRNGKQPQVAPCKDCAERHPACHSDCEKFKGWKERENKAKKEFMENYYCEKYFEHQIYKRQDVKMAEKHRASSLKRYERGKAGKATTLKEGKTDVD